MDLLYMDILFYDLRVAPMTFGKNDYRSNQILIC